ncbi:MAG: rRNA maturation RNase YbeY [Candidatus Omnitrophota bacterium]
MTIRINSENRNKKRKIDLSKAEKVAKIVLKAHKKNSVELNIIFVSNQKIRALNRMWFGKDVSTDVIAWPAGDKGSFLGDIAISSDMAAKNTKVYDLSFKEELALYVIHGTLHLLGYNDTTVQGRTKMRRKEDGLLQESKKLLRR